MGTSGWRTRPSRSPSPWIPTTPPGRERRATGTWSRYGAGTPRTELEPPSQRTRGSNSRYYPSSNQKFRICEHFWWGGVSALSPAPRVVQQPRDPGAAQGQRGPGPHQLPPGAGPPPPVTLEGTLTGRPACPASWLRLVCNRPCADRMGPLHHLLQTDAEG